LKKLLQDFFHLKICHLQDFSCGEIPSPILRVFI
jgi:hypothetical protein